MRRRPATRRNEMHGLHDHPLYGTWHAMRVRCYSPRHMHFANYGGRGIIICARWSHPLNFFDDMGPRPPGTTLDRIDGGGHYSCGRCAQCRRNKWPANCRWAVPTEQQGNRGNNRLLTHAGETLTLAEWSRRTGIKESTIRARLAKGGSTDAALSTPCKPWAMLLQWKGRTQSMSAWAREYGLDQSLVSYRLKSGWTLEQALETPPRAS